MIVAMTIMAQEWLLVASIRTAKCKIILVINHNSLLIELYKPWIKLIYDKKYMGSQKSYKIEGNQKRKTKHMIVTN